MTLQVFGILNTISELSAFVIMCYVMDFALLALAVAALDPDRDLDASDHILVILVYSI